MFVLWWGDIACPIRMIGRLAAACFVFGLAFARETLGAALAFGFGFALGLFGRALA